MGKRVISRMLLVAASIMYVLFCAGNAMAFNTVTDEVVYQNGENKTDEITREDVIAVADNEVRKLDAVKDGKSNIDHEAIQKAMEQELEDNVSALSLDYVDYETVVSTLKVASVLSSADGLSTSQTASMLSTGITAYMDANGNDSYRHFTWNFNSTNDVGSSKARIYTIDYEWANVLLTTYNEYSAERYDYYYNLYYWSIIYDHMDPNSIIDMAIADADDYIVELRNSMKTTCKASKSNFTAVFGNSNIMDFWNNYYGRSYASNYSTLTAANAYDKALNDNVLIINEADVTSSQVTTVYNTNWWYTGY